MPTNYVSRASALLTPALRLQVCQEALATEIKLQR